MKFMKLGSKPDSFLNDGDNIRYVASELATDVIITVGDVKFYLHKFPLLSKSSRLQKLVAATNEETNNEIQIQDIPGGPAAFEICTKFCYGMTVTLNAYNVVAARCAAEYLEMYETIEKGNLIYKIEVFLSSSIFSSWKDSIIVLRSTKAFLPWSDELKVVSHCLDSIASKASIDTSKVEWSYTYNRKKLPSENGNGNELNWNGVRKHQMVPKDWWVEDLCELEIDLYKRVIVTIRSSGRISSDVIGEALRAYTLRRLPGFFKGMIQCGDKNRYLIEAMMRLLPADKGSVPCGFLLKLLKAANLLECEETGKVELMRRIGQQLEEATLTDLLIQAPSGESTMYDVAMVKTLVGEFVMHEKNDGTDLLGENGFEESRSPKYVSGTSKEMVGKLVDSYLSEIASDPNLPLSSFVNLAEMVSSFPRPSHDGLYRAIDMYLKEHPGISKTEKKKICRLMDCKKLSREASMHAVQNERLPLRVVVQVLFFEQARAATSSAGSSTPDLNGAIRSLLPAGYSNGSSRSATTNTEDDWDNNVATTDDLKALKGDLTTKTEKVAGNKMKGVVLSKIFSKMWSGKEKNGEFSSSDTSESPGSANVEETKSTPSRSRRHSVS